MENRSRVQEIRQRFEGVTALTRNTNVSKQPIKPPLAVKPHHLLNNCEPSTKCVIKRSHAFRSDKSKVKFNLAAKESVAGKKQLRNEDKLPPINSVTSQKNLVLSSPLTDTLKKALKAPLPSGPAPRKPPRTFAHNVNGIKKETPPKMELGGNLKNLESRSDNKKQNTHSNNDLVNNNENDQSKQPLETDRMPKERLLAFIKNFENAFEKKKVPSNNGPIYDRLNESPVRSENSNSAHIYSEPYVPRLNKDDQSKKINSLHYMSTAIENIKADNEESPKLEYLIVPLNKLYDENNAESPLADYYAMLPPRPKELNSKSHDVFDEIKSLMIEAYNNGCVHFNEEGEQAQLRALRGEASSKQLTEMFSQMINDSDCRFRERCRIVRKKSVPSEKLLDALLLIGIDTQLDDATKVPYVKARYTQPHVEIPNNIERLVFPDADNWPPISTSHRSTRQSNYFTIVLTRNSGDRSYAYCRRLLPEGSSFCLPLTYVILTGNDDTVFYHKVLDQIEVNHGLPENEYQKFVQSLLDSYLPKLGENLILDDVHITRHEDNRPYEYVISNLLNDLSVPVFLKLFSAILLERKIIVVSTQVSKVCDSVEALCRCLFPFSWQHTVVSVLPSDMSELLQCPTPYLVGLLKGRNHPLTYLENIFAGIENSFIVDVDCGTILNCMGDEMNILPKRLTKSLKSSLYLCPVKGPDTCASATLLRLFVELVGHYPLVIINGPSSELDKPGFRVFLRNSFVSALSSKSTEHFLRLFVDTAMFEAFIRERLDNLDFKMGLFEKSCVEFIAEEVRKPSGLLKTITLNRTVKILGDQFLKEE
ncbi:DENN domain-containing protein 2B-like isoform X2 [Rhodnius prolixus]|uniref:DENN domain-containing protein 2B-like isoform X2 n=1 Tax=Rhodnius prolixus TaxID=13249 RepID=UPI003D18EA31